MNLFRAARRLLAAVAWVAAVGMAHGAAAQGGIQVDTAAFSTISPSLCTVGQACNASHNLGFSMSLGNGTTYDKVYIYREGVIGLGSALPTGATFGDLNTLGGAWFAAAFGDYTGFDVHITFALSGGRDHNLDPFVNDNVLIDWFVNTHTSDVAALPADQRGEFQIKLHTGQYGVGGGTSIGAAYGGSPFDHSPATNGLLWLGSGVPPGAVAGSNLSGVSNIPDTFVPEPATWALLIGGFGLVGLEARRRRRILTPV